MALYVVTFTTTVEADDEDAAIDFAQNTSGHWEAEVLN